MNLKGLTQEQESYLRFFLETHVAGDEAPVLVPLLEASIGRIAANLIRSYNEQLAGRDSAIDLSGNAAMPKSKANYSVRKAIEHLAPGELDHILDWFRASVIERAAWLHNVDDRGRPRKLLKCATFADLSREADKAMDRRNAERARTLGPGDERHVADLAEGFSFVRLLTAEALDLESSRMRHCVGHGAYDAAVQSDDIAIYSLRDARGRPVLTVEVDIRGGKHRESSWPLIMQVRGKRNAAPEPRHLGILKPFILESRWRGEARTWPRVFDVDGWAHEPHAIPAGTAFGSLYLSWDARHGELRLPRELHVSGSLGIVTNGARIMFGARTMIGLDLTIAGIDDAPVSVVLLHSMQVGGRILLPPGSDRRVPRHLMSKVYELKPDEFAGLPGAGLRGLEARERAIMRLGPFDALFAETGTGMQGGDRIAAQQRQRSSNLRRVPDNLGRRQARRDDALAMHVDNDTTTVSAVDPQA